MTIKSLFKLAIYKNGRPFFGQVKLEIKESFKGHLIEEKYSGNGFCSQGRFEVISEDGYELWKSAIREGVRYALTKITSQKKFKIIIIEAVGLSTDTNPTIMGYVSSRAILNEIDNSESIIEKNKLEELLYSSWQFGFNGQPDFNQLIIITK